MDHISKWAENNNLTLNINKTMEMIVRKPRAKTCQSLWYWWYETSQDHESPWCFQTGQSFFRGACWPSSSWRCPDTLRTKNVKTSWTEWPSSYDSCKLHSFGKIDLCIPCMVGTDWLGRIAATAVNGIQGRQTSPRLILLVRKMTWDFLMPSWMTTSTSLTISLSRSNRGYI